MRLFLKNGLFVPGSIPGWPVFMRKRCARLKSIRRDRGEIRWTKFGPLSTQNMTYFSNSIAAAVANKTNIGPKSVRPRMVRLAPKCTKTLENALGVHECEFWATSNFFGSGSEKHGFAVGAAMGFVLAIFGSPKQRFSACWGKVTDQESNLRP